jgi:hypothetical protein
MSLGRQTRDLVKTMILIAATGGVLVVIARWVLAAQRARIIGWRVGHVGRDGMFYEELVDGRWERLDIDGEMLVGGAHHIIYFASEAEWVKYPAWARSRRAEIVGRIESALSPPDYEHQGA